MPFGIFSPMVALCYSRNVTFATVDSLETHCRRLAPGTLFDICHQLLCFSYKRRMIMIQPVRNKNIISMLLVVVFLVLSAVSDASAHRRPYRHHHSKTKGAIIGGAAGAAGGGLIGGQKGAGVGAGAGAGADCLDHPHRNRRSPR